MTHYQQRTHERKYTDLLTSAQLEGLCWEYQSAAVILAKLDGTKGQNYGDYRSRTESNGDLVILIIRDHKPITIMYRRSNQKLTAESMRVNELISLL